MDFNQLLSEHQIALIRASSAHDADERQRQNDKADRIASRITRLQHVSHVHAVPLMPAATL